MNQTPQRYLVNLTDCISKALEWERLLIDAIHPLFTKYGYEYTMSSKQFEPTGATVVSLFDKGHFAIHTWPEHQRAAIDFLILDPTEEDQEHGSGFIRCLKDNLPGSYNLINLETAVSLEQQSNARELQKRFIEGVQKGSTEYIGQEVIAQLYGQFDSQYANPRKLLNLLREITEKAKFKTATEVLRKEKDYSQAAIVLTTSHISAHYNRAQERMFIDVFTCSDGKEDEGDAIEGFDQLITALKPKSYEAVYGLR